MTSDFYDYFCQGHCTANCSKCQYRKLQLIIIKTVMKMFRRIKDLREDKDLTQKQMSEILHCSQQVYSNYELGQRDIPTSILIALSKFHGVSTDYILGLTDKK